MNVVKSVVRAVLPIISTVLRSAAKKTDTPFDDHIVEGVIKAIESWLDDTENDVEFN